MSSFVPFSFQYKFNLEIIFLDANPKVPTKASRTAYPVRLFFRSRTMIFRSHCTAWFFFRYIDLTGPNNYPNMESMKCTFLIFCHLLQAVERQSMNETTLRGHKSAIWSNDGRTCILRSGLPRQRELVPNFAHSWKS